MRFARFRDLRMGDVVAAITFQGTRPVGDFGFISGITYGATWNRKQFLKISLARAGTLSGSSGGALVNLPRRSLGQLSRLHGASKQ